MRLMSREGGVIAGYGPLFAKLRACRFAKQDAAPEHALVHPRQSVSAK